MNSILPEDWKVLKEDAANIISKIDVLRMNGDDYVMLGASLAILDHNDYMPDIMGYSAAESALQGENKGSQSMLSDYMADELADAEKYLKLWRETGNADFKEISKQELSHFELVAKYARSTEPDLDLQPYIVHHNSLLAKLV